MPKPLNLEIQKMANGQHPMDKESDGQCCHDVGIMQLTYDLWCLQVDPRCLTHQ